MRNGRPEGAEPLSASVRRRIGVEVKDEALLRQALCHRSAVPFDAGMSYERLEFLGDAVLSFLLCEWLYVEFPGMSEGDMAKRRAFLASKPVLADVGLEFGLDDIIMVGPTAEVGSDRHRHSIRADVVEALIGAVYLNRGLRSARGLVRRLLKRAFRHIATAGYDVDSKTRLQELTQARYGVLPTYEVSAPEGEAHRPTFTAVVRVGERVLGTGRGASKKAAQQEAARRAIEKIDEAGGPAHGETH